MLRFVRLFSAFIVVTGGFLTLEPSTARASESFCGVCMSICPVESSYGTVCMGAGCAMTQPFCITDPLCSNPNHVLFICSGNPT